jgi:hypothetical protein
LISATLGNRDQLGRGRPGGRNEEEKTYKKDKRLTTGQVEHQLDSFMGQTQQASHHYIKGVSPRLIERPNSPGIAG